MSMFTTALTPWSSFGHNIAGCDSIQEAMEKAGLHWAVEKVPLLRKDFVEKLFDLYDTPEKVRSMLHHADVEECQAFIRDDTREVVGTPGARTEPLQNVEMFDWFQPLLDSGEARLETAGCLKGGRRMWVLAEMCKNVEEIVPGDEVAKYLLLSNSHDNTLAVRVGFTPIRVVCANTLAMAHSEAKKQNAVGKLIRVRHSKDVVVNITKLREAMDIANAAFVATAEQYKALARRDINQKDLEKYFRIVLGYETEGELATRASNTVDVLKNLFETGIGSDIPAVKGTYWAAYNSVTEYYNYRKGREGENRMDSLWFGAGHADNDKALTLALEMAA